MSERYGCGDADVGHYTCRRTAEKIVVDGRLSETCWQRAEKSPRFVDMVTGVPGFLDTRMAALWDDENLYIAFQVEEPNVQAHYTERDSPVYFENDVEVAVHVDGVLNDASRVDKGWTVELAFPWEGMAALAQGRALPPKDGDIWRMDFSRFEALQYNGRTTDPSVGWSFNKHGVYDSHIPECFTCVHFSEETV